MLVLVGAELDFVPPMLTRIRELHDDTLVHAAVSCRHGVVSCGRSGNRR
jgi:hypothetical protein